MAVALDQAGERRLVARPGGGDHGVVTVSGHGGHTGTLRGAGRSSTGRDTRRREVSAKRRAYGRFLPTPRDPSSLPTTHDGGIDDEAIGDDLVGEIAPFASGER